MARCRWYEERATESKDVVRYLVVSGSGRILPSATVYHYKRPSGGDWQVYEPYVDGSPFFETFEDAEAAVLDALGITDLEESIIEKVSLDKPEDYIEAQCFALCPRERVERMSRVHHRGAA